jgi:hypothetical protein
VALLRIQQLVPDYDRWKRSFVSDQLQRGKSGVIRYSIHRGVGDRRLIMIDLEFSTTREAEIFLSRLHRVWAAGGMPVESPDAWIVETVEQADLAGA